MTDYTSRVCASCERAFIPDEDDETVCCDCREYEAAIRNLPPQEGK